MFASAWMLRYIARRFNPIAIMRSFFLELSAWRRFFKSRREFNRVAPSDRRADSRTLYPCLGDDVGTTPIEPVYFYQDSWAFEHIVKERPSHHVDIGSHHKYVALLSKVLPVTMVDIRPLSLPLDSIQFEEGTVLNMPYETGSLQSISSLCVLEHIGLGRYGDLIDPFGSEKAIEELKRVLAPGGNLFISVPVNDKNTTYFNAHRAFAEDYLLELLKPLKVIEKRYIYGNSFGDVRKKGFGVGCYWAKRI